MSAELVLLVVLLVVLLREKTAAPGVPGILRLGWMLFMQPKRLGEMLLPNTMFLPLWQLWKNRASASGDILRVLQRLAAFSLILATGLAVLTGILIEVAGDRVVWGNLFGRIFFAGIIGILLGTVLDVRLGAIACVGAAVPVWPLSVWPLPADLFRVHYGGTTKLLLIPAVSLVKKVGVSLAAAPTLALAGRFRRSTIYVFVGFLVGFYVLMLALQVPYYVEGTARTGTPLSIVGIYVLTWLRIPIYAIEAVWVIVATNLVGRYPRLAARLPFLYDELILLPLLGLRAFLLRLAERNPVSALEAIDKATVTLAQRGIALRVLYDLRAHSLERAARDRTWSLAASPSCPVPTTPPSRPVRCTLSATPPWISPLRTSPRISTAAGPL